MTKSKFVLIEELRDSVLPLGAVALNIISMTRLTVLSLVMTFSVSTWAAEYFLFPAAVRLEGVGGIYGIGAGAEKIFAERSKVLAGATVGEVQAAGIMLSDIPLGVSNLGLNLAFASVQKARFLSSYSRGLEQTNTFEQEISATAYGGGLDWLLLDKTLKLSVGILLSEVRLEEFYLDERKVIRPNTGGYFPIETSSKLISLDWDKSDKEAQRGFKLGVGIATADGRAGQSDLLVSNWRASAYLPIAEPLILAFHSRWSDAYVTKKESRYTSAASAKEALATDCASITDSTERNRCQSLEDSIADYVARSNSAGTAAPIGGSNGLRAYDELGVRAAHTRLLSTELRWKVAELGPVTIAATPFYDLGWGADRAGDAFKKSADSYGIGLRATYKTMPVRLGYAESKSQSAWFFTLGQAF